MKYSVLVQYDSRDKIYVASIPELKGCIAHGETQETAMHEIKIALELWIEAARENNISVPEPMLYVS